jgi:hypothetical protein
MDMNGKIELIPEQKDADGNVMRNHALTIDIHAIAPEDYAALVSGEARLIVILRSTVKVPEFLHNAGTPVTPEGEKGKLVEIPVRAAFATQVRMVGADSVRQLFVDETRG